MSLSSSVAEPCPQWTGTAWSGSDLVFSGSGFSTNSLLELRGIYSGSHGQNAIWYHSGTGSGIHNRSGFSLLTPGSPFNWTLYHPLAYHQISPARVLEDIVRFQAHCDQGLIRKFPDTDQVVTGWTTNDIAGYHWRSLAEGTDDPDFTNGNWTSTLNQLLVLGFFASLPSSVGYIKGLRVNIWAAFQETGSAQGNCLRVVPYHSAVSGSPGSGTRIGSSYGKWHVDHISSTSGLYVFTQNEWKGLNLTRSQCDSLELFITPYRGYSGGSPASVWYLFAIDIDLWCEVVDVSPTLVNQSTFDTVESYFSSTYTSPAYTLDGDLFELTLAEALLKVIAHAPEVVLYNDNFGALTATTVPDLSTASASFVTGTRHDSFLGIRGIFSIDDNLKTEFTVGYSSKVESSAQTSPGVEDYDNTVGHLKWIDERDRWKRIPKDAPADIERELFRDSAVASYFLDNDRTLFQETIPGIDVELNCEIFETDTVDIFEISVPDLGIIDKKYWSIRKEIDLDEMSGIVRMIDRSFVPPT